MATNVTVTRVYANPDHFQGKNTPQYVYSGAASSQGGGIQWLGSTLNAVGTYTAPGYITANDDMLWDGDLLSLGTKLTAAKQAADVVVQVGSVTAGAHGAVEIVGNQIINGTIGTLSFHNEASAHARNTVAELAVTRVGDADSGQITLKLADSDANLDDVYIVSELFHNWAVAGVSEMWLSDAALYPNTVGGLTLGTSGAPWGAAFAASALLTGMATTGNRMVYADSTGLLTDLSWLTWSGTGTLEIGTGLTSAHLDLEYGGTNPYSISASAANGLYIHEYSTDIATFTTALVTVVSPVRMDDLASTGNRIMFTDADGDVSAPDWLTISGTSILEIGTGLTYSSLALEFGGANPYELSANDTDGMFIHLYSDRIMTFTDTLITTAVDVRMDSLAGTGDRMVVADADGDLSTQAIPVVDPMVYPGAGIPLSTGTAWDTSITDNSATWNAAQPGHVNLTSLAGLTYVSSAFVKMTAAGTFTLDTTTYSEQTLSLGTANQIPHMTGTTDFTYTTGFTFDGTAFSVPGGLFAPALTEGTGGDYILTWDAATGEFIYDNDILITGAPSGIRFASAASTLSWVGTGTEIWLDGSGNLTFKDAVAGTLTLDDLNSGGTSYWTQSGTSLSPATSGDDILLRDSTERLLFGDGDTYIYEAADDQLITVVGGNNAFTSNTTNNISSLPLVPSSNKAYDLGGIGAFWDNGYFDRLYVDSTNIYIDVNGTDMRFVSPTAGTVDLADLAGGGTTYTFSNGLTEAAGAVVLGGALTGDTTISAETYNFGIGANSTTLSSQTTINSGGFSTKAYNATYQSVSNGYGNLQIAPTSVTFGLYNSSYEKKAIIFSGTSMTVWDQISSRGFIYAADYSTAGAALGDRWIPDKGYVDGAIAAGGSSYTFSNCLTETAGAVVLGGEFTSDIALTSTGLDARGWDFSIKQRDFSSSTELLVRQADISFACYSQDDWDVTDLHTQIQLTTSYVELARGSASNGWKMFSITSTEMEIRDSEDEIGLQYEADYSTNGAALGDRWIPDKGYVDGLSGTKVIRIQHSDDGTTLDIADLGLGDVAWSDISIMMYVVTAFDSSAPQLHIGNSAHTATYYLAAGDPGWATTGFKTFTLGNDPNFISGDETINCQYNDSTSDGTVGDAYLYFSYISS